MDTKPGSVIAAIALCLLLGVKPGTALAKDPEFPSMGPTGCLSVKQMHAYETWNGFSFVKLNASQTLAVEDYMDVDPLVRQVVTEIYIAKYNEKNDKSHDTKEQKDKAAQVFADSVMVELERGECVLGVAKEDAQDIAKVIAGEPVSQSR